MEVKYKLLLYAKSSHKIYKIAKLKRVRDHRINNIGNILYDIKLSILTLFSPTIIRIFLFYRVIPCCSNHQLSNLHLYCYIWIFSW